MSEAMTIQEQCKLALPRFEHTAGKVPWCPRSILKSEGLAVCAMADLHEIDLLIESGVCNGRSTEMWCRYFGSRDIAIHAIDWEIKAEARTRLEHYRHVVLHNGDATDKLPALLANTKGLRIGIFIDGPKDIEAVDLAQSCFEDDAVRFVGVHDMATLQHGKPHGPREELKYAGCGHYDFLTTDAPWFVELSHHLDTDESHLDEEQGTRWTPYCRHELGKPPMPLGSYGYTIGFLSKEVL